MKLAGWQFKQIQDALLSGYSQKYALAEMVRVELNEDLEVIAGGESLQEIAFSLLTWAEDHGRLNDLVLGAVKHNAGNRNLQQLGADYAEWQLQVEGPPTQPHHPMGRLRGCHAKISIDFILPVVVVTLAIISIFDYSRNQQQAVPSVTPVATAIATPDVTPRAPASSRRSCPRVWLQDTPLESLLPAPTPAQAVADGYRGVVQQGYHSASAAAWRELAAPGWIITGEVYSVATASGTTVGLPPIQRAGPRLVPTTLHIVQPNETLEQIATYYCVAPDEIAASNGLTVTHGMTLTAGTRLSIPMPALHDNVRGTAPGNSEP